MKSQTPTLQEIEQEQDKSIIRKCYERGFKQGQLSAYQKALSKWIENDTSQYFQDWLKEQIQGVRGSEDKHG